MSETNPYIASLEEQARAKGAKPFTSTDEFAGDVFESDEELDEFIAWVRTSRRLNTVVDADLVALITRVNEDNAPIELTSEHGNAVLISAADYAALREGAYLMRSPANARRLLAAYQNATRGRG